MHPGIADVAIGVQRAGEVFRVQPDIADRQSGIDQADQVGNVAVEQVDTEDAAIREATLVAQVESRSEEHTSELQSLMRISYAVFWLKKKQKTIYEIT